MCGISGIVYNLDEQISDFDFHKLSTFSENLLSVKLDVSSIDRLLELLSSFEDSVNSLFVFSNFYEVYSDVKKREEVLNFLSSLDKYVNELEHYISVIGVSISIDTMEKFNSILIRFKDITWRIHHDLLNNISKINDLSFKFNSKNKKLIYELWKLNFILNNIDRLEVRGRDSAGLSAMVTFEHLADFKSFRNELDDKLKGEYEKRVNQEDFINASISESLMPELDRASVVFVFKVAEEIGNMGDNVATLRNYIKNDILFLNILTGETSDTNFFAHTRWASNGIINEQNCHPVNNETLGGKNVNKPYCISTVLNGDIDNFQELKEKFTSLTNRRISENITTDTKIIPLMVEKYYEENNNLFEAFRMSLNEFKGSMAISMQSSLEPDKTYLALRGSGQALFIGLIKGGYVFASELYGIVEESSTFVKLEGDKERVPGDLSTQGQIFVLNSSGGGLENIKAYYFDGVEINLTEEHLKHAEITTRDINRGEYPHFLLKEISESPLSVEKTMRGKFEIKSDTHGETALFNINNDIIPEIVVHKLKSGDIKKICLIGQGTASIAGNGIANFMSKVLVKSGLQIVSTKATELSGFLLEDNMSHVLVIAVSQSGTTTDTNRTVDLVKSRGGHVIAIVNRRNSDLVYKSDGVFYTSDGRDIEMSVASTKAFYSQIVSGTIIALYFAQVLSALPSGKIVEELKELISLPEKMYNILNGKEEVRKAAEDFAVTRKYWAVVGSGPNKVSADEIRIKLSELCYKSIATDTTEDKKHIDLSSEPLVIVCVAGVTGSNLHDMVKEVAIFKAHKGCPIVITTEDNEHLFKPYASSILITPKSSEGVAVLLNTVVGHLWGYYAANSIDKSGEILKKARVFTVEALVKSAKSDPYDDKKIIKELTKKIYSTCRNFYSLLRKGRYNSCLEVNNASQLGLLFKYIQGRIPLDDFEYDFAIAGNLNNVLNEAVRFLSLTIADLTRPIDAIKHQAKTVTVGISRLEEVPTGLIFDKLKEENISLTNVTYQNNFILQAVCAAVDNITGSTRYEISGLDSLGSPNDTSEIKTISKSGLSSSMSSRGDIGTLLIGRKRSVVEKQKVFVGKGSSDGRTIIIIPLIEKGICNSLLLLHVDYKKELELESKVNILKALDKYEEIKYIIMEMNIPWNDSILETLDVSDLVNEDIEDIAEAISCAAVGN